MAQRCSWIAGKTGKPCRYPANGRFCLWHHPLRKQAKGWIDSQGYRRIIIRGREYKEHRYLMERILGRSLERYEHVHHNNGNRADNRLKNLTVLDVRAHSMLHLLENGMIGTRKLGKRTARKHLDAWTQGKRLRLGAYLRPKVCKHCHGWFQPDCARRTFCSTKCWYSHLKQRWPDIVGRKRVVPRAS